MRYALVKDGLVVNIIKASQEFVDALSDYDYKVEVDDSTLIQIGHTYNGSTFSTPSVPIDFEGIVKKAENFGSDLIRKFAAENVSMGITQAGKTADVRKALGQVIICLQTGSLYDAMAEIRLIPTEDKDATFLTDARLLIVINLIEDYLGRPHSTSL
jgi:hypothetical protein